MPIFSVTVHCKDTKIVVNVGTNRPFSGRVYALGRSETCNVDVINSNSFRLDLTMGGQDCNTQTVVSKTETDFTSLEVLIVVNGFCRAESTPTPWSYSDTRS